MRFLGSFIVEFFAGAVSGSGNRTLARTTADVSARVHAELRPGEHRLGQEIEDHQHLVPVIPAADFECPRLYPVLAESLTSHREREQPDCRA